MTTVEKWLGDENTLGIDIWRNKYQYEDETFEEWLDRVSNGDNDLRKLIEEKKFLFGGRILANRGLHKSGKKITYSNCYVLSEPEDNIESIFECAKKLARTFSYGGGCGIDISKLSPKGAKINNAAKETSGAVSFMDLYSMITGLIGQGGRRGALMLSIDCSHPDLEDFIGIKSDLERVTKANISVKMSNEFMNAVQNNEDYTLKFTRVETGENITKTVKAKELFKKLCEMNWDMAEPGILFWDNITGYSLMSNTEDFRYAGTNPCAEEPLPPGGSCLLGSINLNAFVDKNSKTFNFDEFKNAVKISVKALNDVLDEGLPLHPLQEQRDSVRDWRQIGLGIMGIADMLINMGITYGSDESIKLCDEIGFVMANTAIKTSAKLAKEYGAFPKCKTNNIITTDYFINNTDEKTRDLVMEYGLRNSQILTIAPTGSISTMLQISGGIEPIFANYYTRKTESLHNETVEYKVYTPIVKDYMDNHNMTDDKYLPEFFITAQNLDYKNRVDMQSVWQKHIDASISSTVNLPHETTIEQVEELYSYAWQNGLKGITVYRDGCKRSGILTTDNTKTDDKPFELSRGDIIEVNDDVIGKKRKLTTGCGSLHCSAFFDPATGELLETYFSKGSTGGCNNFMIGLSRMISLLARSGVNIHTIVEQLNSCGVCPSYAVRHATKKDTSKGSCCPVAIGYALLDMYNEMQNEINADCENDDSIDDDSPKCPECGEILTFEGGCNICKSCGWSKCD